MVTVRYRDRDRAWPGEIAGRKRDGGTEGRRPGRQWRKREGGREDEAREGGRGLGGRERREKSSRVLRSLRTSPVLQIQRSNLTAGPRDWGDSDSLRDYPSPRSLREAPRRPAAVSRDLLGEKGLSDGRSPTYGRRRRRASEARSR
jgi:hypothetical protein